MKIYSKNIVNNWLDKEFGANATNKDFFKNEINTKSFHIGWSDLDKNTKSLAIIFQDYDAIEVCGFCWIHWTVANIDPNLNELDINASNTLKDQLVQGKNSWASKLISSNHEDPVYASFGGCAPPNKDHEYEVTVYALDTKLDLKNGFYMNELIHAMKNHIIDQATIKFMYEKVK